MYPRYFPAIAALLFLANLPAAIAAPAKPASKTTSSAARRNRLNAELLAAADSGNATRIKLLIGSGAEVNALGSSGGTALIQVVQFASSSGDFKAYLEIVKYLLDKGARINVRDYANNTALMWAASSPEMTALLLSRGADAKLSDGQGRNALHSAAINWPPPKVVELLLAAGIDPKAQDNAGRTALMEIANLEWTQSPPVPAGLAANRLQSLELLLAGDHGVNLQDKSGMTALRFARDASAIKLLLKHGADPNLKDKFGNSPLVQAIRDAESVRLLIKAGAKPNNADLAEAAFYDDPEIIKLLLANGVDPKLTTGNAPVPFIRLFQGIAFEEGEIGSIRKHLSVANLLKQAGADVNASDNTGTTPLMTAVRRWSEILREDMSEPDSTPLRWLLANGADSTKVDKQGRTALLLLCATNRPESTDLDTVAYQQTQLLEIATLLVKYGAQVNARSTNGYTPLKWALQRKHTKLAQFLRQKGAK